MHRLPIQVEGGGIDVGKNKPELCEFFSDFPSCQETSITRLYFQDPDMRRINSQSRDLLRMNPQFIWWSLPVGSLLRFQLTADLRVHPTRRHVL